MVSVALLFGLLFSASSVYAGSINGPEAGLISKASGTFQYQGKRYVATAAAMGQLRAYLSRDDVDLTQDQANRAASLMYSNVEGGVLDGYLTPVGGAAAGTGGAVSYTHLDVYKRQQARRSAMVLTISSLLWTRQKI